MSHTVTIQAELKDPAALEAACRRLQLPLPTHVDMRGHVLDGWLYAYEYEKRWQIPFQYPKKAYEHVADVRHASRHSQGFGVPARGVSPRRTLGPPVLVCAPPGRK